MKKKRLGWLLAFSALFFALDALSKVWANAYFGVEVAHEGIYPYGGMGVFNRFFGIDFCLNRVTNRGGAWGVFSSYPYLLLTCRLIITTSLFLYALFFNRTRSRDVPFLLLLTGALCNLFDFFFYGHVVDFLHFVLWGYSFPVFNFADVMIFFGIVLLFLQSFRTKNDFIPVSDRSALE